jgi:integrating conjugative element protein (TIGR03761 family)
MSDENNLDGTQQKDRKRFGLRSEVSINLHSYAARNAFDGRMEEGNRAAIIGINRFAGAVKQIFHDARADDPWADWWLIKIDGAVEQAKNKMHALRQEFADHYPETPDINVNDAIALAPQSRALSFASPHAYRMAYMLVDYDKLCCSVLTLAHVGLMTQAEKLRYLDVGGKIIKAALTSAVGFRHQGVTRNDLIANNPRAQKAKQLMGEVPQDIVDLKRRSPYAPELIQYSDDADADIDAPSEPEPDQNVAPAKLVDPSIKVTRIASGT